MLIHIVSRAHTPPGESPEFDFDEWLLLAQKNPAAYFQRREKVISEFISAHPEHAARLQETQDRVDAMRAIAGSPDQALRGIMQMLEDQVDALGNQMHQLRDELENLQAMVPVGNS